jgi:hypothetical protein
MTAPRPRPGPPARESTPWRRPAWPPETEAHIAKVLATFPPLGPRQRELLARLLDLGGGHDEGC